VKLPFDRQNAEAITRHHLLFEKPQWEYYEASRSVSRLGSFVVGAVRSHHDYLHATFKPVPVPGFKVLDILYGIGKAFSGFHNDQERTDQILEEMIGFAKSTPSPEQCHDMLGVAVSIEAQMSLLGLMKGIKI